MLNMGSGPIALRLLVLGLSVLTAAASLHLMFSWTFQLHLETNTIISISQTIEMDVLDIASRAEDKADLVYGVINAFAVFCILSLLSPRFALVPPFLLLLSGFFLSGDFQGTAYRIVDYTLDTSGAMDYAVTGFAVTLSIAVLANLIMRIYYGGRFHHGLLFNILPYGIRGCGGPVSAADPSPAEDSVGSDSDGSDSDRMR